MTRRISIPAILLPVLLLLPTASPRAQSFASDVWTLLEGAYETVSEQGYSTRNYIIGHLNEGESDTWTLGPFFSGNTYRLVGVCDNDCEDLDIVVTQNGREIVRDTLVDAIPVVTFTPQRDTQHEIKVTMYECSVEPCYFGFGIFYRNN